MKGISALIVLVTVLIATPVQSASGLMLRNGFVAAPTANDLVACYAAVGTDDRRTFKRLHTANKCIWTSSMDGTIHVVRDVDRRFRTFRWHGKQYWTLRRAIGGQRPRMQSASWKARSAWR